MNQPLVAPVALTALGIAFFHAAIPTHWLPFVLTGRAQRWNSAKTLIITGLAGAGHVAVTAAFGLLLAWMGVALSEKIGIWFPRVAGGGLFVLGALYVWRQRTGAAHWHVFHPHSHGHDHPPVQNGEVTAYEKRLRDLSEAREPSKTTDLFAITTLLALLTFSPCEAFVGFYVVGIRFGWGGLLLLTLVFLAGTVAGMTLFTWAALAGFRKINLGVLEKYEDGLTGALLCAIGVLIVFFAK